MDSATADRRSAHRRVGAAAGALFVVLLLLGATHGPAAADSTAPVATPTVEPTQPAPSEPAQPAPDEDEPRFWHRHDRDGGPGFGGGGHRGGGGGGAPDGGGSAPSTGGGRTGTV